VTVIDGCIGIDRGSSKRLDEQRYEHDETLARRGAATREKRVPE
jgi:hypothetical protein